MKNVMITLLIVILATASAAGAGFYQEANNAVQTNE